MRNFLSARFAAALGIPIVVAFLIYAVLMNSGSSSQSASKVVHFVNYTASVNIVQAESGWSVVQATSRSTARLALDDARTVFIAEGTPGEITCTDFPPRMLVCSLQNYWVMLWSGSHLLPQRVKHCSLDLRYRRLLTC
jgi:hypothetical protein